MIIIYYDDKGLITNASFNIEPDETLNWMYSDILPTPSLSKDYYVKMSTIVLRPELDVNETYTVSLNTDLTIPNIPENSEIFFGINFMGLTDNSDLILNFDSTGVHEIKINPPFPFINKTIRVTVI